jgi:hypothetical protein
MDQIYLVSHFFCAKLFTYADWQMLPMIFVIMLFTIRIRPQPLIFLILLYFLGFFVYYCNTNNTWHLIDGTGFTRYIMPIMPIMLFLVGTYEQ